MPAGLVPRSISKSVAAGWLMPWEPPIKSTTSIRRVGMLARMRTIPVVGLGEALGIGHGRRGAAGVVDIVLHPIILQILLNPTKSYTLYLTHHSIICTTSSAMSTAMPGA